MMTQLILKYVWLKVTLLLKIVIKEKYQLKNRYNIFNSQYQMKIYQKVKFKLKKTNNLHNWSFRPIDKMDFNDKEWLKLW